MQRSRLSPPPSFAVGRVSNHQPYTPTPAIPPPPSLLRRKHGTPRPAATYGRALVRHRSYIYKHLARSEPGSLLDPGSIAWCLTVPAMWDEAAKARMRQAANRAGEASAAAVLGVSMRARLGLDLARLGWFRLDRIRKPTPPWPAGPSRVPFTAPSAGLGCGKARDALERGILACYYCPTRTRGTTATPTRRPLPAHARRRRTLKLLSAARAMTMQDLVLPISCLKRP